MAPLAPLVAWTVGTPAQVGGCVGCAPVRQPAQIYRLAFAVGPGRTVTLRYCAPHLRALLAALRALEGDLPDAGHSR